MSPGSEVFSPRGSAISSSGNWSPGISIDINTISCRYSRRLAVNCAECGNARIWIRQNIANLTHSIRRPDNDVHEPAGYVNFLDHRHACEISGHVFSQLRGCNCSLLLDIGCNLDLVA